MNKIAYALAIFVVGGLLTPLHTAAQTTMSVFTGQSQENKFDISLQSKLTFGDGSMQLLKGETSVASFKIADINKIIFNFDPAGIEDVATPAGTISLRNNPVYDVLSFEGAPVSPSLLELYTIGGSRVMALNGWAGEDVDLSGLPAGMYVLRIDNQSFKIIKL